MGIKSFFGGDDPEQKEQTTFFPYYDSMGNKLEAKDILFQTNSREDDSVFIWMKNPSGMAEYHTEKDASFPVAVSLIDKDGQKNRLDVKRSIKSDVAQELPPHAGCYETISMVFCGSPFSGKTTYFLQLNHPSFLNIASRALGGAFTDEYRNSKDPRIEEYRKMRNDFFENKVFPRKTLDGSNPPEYVYLVQKSDGSMPSFLLKLRDLPGEAPVKMGVEMEGIIFASGFIVITVDAEDLINENTEQLENIIMNLKDTILYHGQRHFLVMVTKGDLLMESLYEHIKNTPEFEGLEWAMDNTLMIDPSTGKLSIETNQDGDYYFDLDRFEKKSRILESYISKKYFNLSEKIKILCQSNRGSEPEDDVMYCIVSSIGSVPIENTQKQVAVMDGREIEIDDGPDYAYHYEEYMPYCIEEPIFYVLYKRGFLPGKGDAKVNRSGAKGENESKGFKGFQERAKEMFDEIIGD